MTPRVHFGGKHPNTELQVRISGSLLDEFISYARLLFPTAPMNRFKSTATLARPFSWIPLHGNGSGGSWVMLFLEPSAIPKGQTKHDFSEIKMK